MFCRSKMLPLHMICLSVAILATPLGASAQSGTLPPEHPTEHTASAPPSGGDEPGFEQTEETPTSEPTTAAEPDGLAIETTAPPVAPEPGQEIAESTSAPDPKVAEAAPVTDPAAESTTAATPAPETPPAAPKRPPVWQPFVVGNSWTYVYVRERSRANDGETPSVERLHGSMTRRVVGEATEYGAGVFEVVTELSGRKADSGEESESERRAFLMPRGAVIDLLAEEDADPILGGEELTRYSEPLHLLDSRSEPGERWQVGVRRHGELEIALEGEILGVQDVQTPHGLFERCLVVRLQGPISGVIEANGIRMEVPEGQYSATEWYAPNVGRVLSKVELSQKLVLDDGHTLEYSERTQFALRSMESGGSVPAKSESAAQ